MSSVVHCANVFCRQRYDFAPKSYETYLLNGVMPELHEPLFYCPNQTQLRNNVHKFHNLFKQNGKNSDFLKKRYNDVMEAAEEMRNKCHKDCYDEQQHLIEDLQEALDQARRSQDDLDGDMINYWKFKLLNVPNKKDVTVADAFRFIKWQRTGNDGEHIDHPSEFGDHDFTDHRNARKYEE